MILRLRVVLGMEFVFGWCVVAFVGFGLVVLGVDISCFGGFGVVVVCLV